MTIDLRIRRLKRLRDTAADLLLATGGVTFPEYCAIKRRIQDQVKVDEDESGSVRPTGA
jgi:hypothetical protein